jgi:hypothetical protein
VPVAPRIRDDYRSISFAEMSRAEQFARWKLNGGENDFGGAGLSPTTSDTLAASRSLV